MWLFYGAVFGLVAAAFDWLDAALTAYLALCVIAGVIIFAVARRRGQPRRPLADQ